MNRSLTALFASFEALLVVGIGIAIPLAPLTILWGVQYGFAADWGMFWRASVDVWLLGHGVDMTMVLDPLTATSLGFPDAAQPVTLTIAALGFSLLTVLLGVRAGHRVAETRYRLLGEFVSISTFGLLSFLLALSAIYPSARPSLWQGTILPTVVFGIGIVIGSLKERRSDGEGSSIRDWINDWRPQSRIIVAQSLRGGAAAAAVLVLAASVLAAIQMTLSYSRMISLYESLHTEVLGGLVLTLGELAFLPNLVIWTASWLIGPGFTIGTGSMVSPLATQLGPLPAIPLLGAVPVGEHSLGFIGLLAPVLAGFFVAIVIRGGVIRGIGGANRNTSLLAVGLGVGAVGGIVLGLLAWFSSGAAGPGRLVDVGPNPWSVGIWAAVEFSAGALLGLFATARNPLARREKAPR
jgi:hypothetical protein